jgi:hypothetical protein
MNEKDLGKALLAGEHPVNIDELTRNVLRRDRRRVLSLAVASVMAWMLVVALPWSTLLPMMAKIVEHSMSLNQNVPTTDPTTAAAREQTIQVLMIVKKGTILTFAGSMISMFLAAVCTMAFIIVSRRATLRQVNVRLGEISDQLKLLAGKKA